MTDAVKTLSVVYRVDNEQAIRAQAQFAESTRQTGSAISSASDQMRQFEARVSSLSTSLSQARERVQRMVGVTGQVASSLSALSGQIGTSGGSGVAARLSLLAAEASSSATALGSLGSLLTPGGLLVGAIFGATIPALRALFDALTPTVPALESVSGRMDSTAESAERMAASVGSAADRMREFLRSVSTSARRDELFSLNAQITELADQIDRVSRAGTVEERLQLPLLRERMSSLIAESAAISQGLATEESEIAAGRRRVGGTRPRTSAPSGPSLEQLMASSTRPDEDPFGLNRLASEYASRRQQIQREIDAENERRAAEERAELERQLEHLRILDEEDQRMIEARRQRHAELASEIAGQIESAATMWGSAIGDAYMTAISGQEDFGVAVAKGFKQIAVQFGGQMIAEGIGALFTAIGNTVLNPPVAATKAAEGAGKLALGLSLGAAGAAISVPSAAPQSPTPRLGPGSGDQKGSSVVVNLNAPSVVTGSASQVGRVISRTVAEANERFGRLS